MSWLTKLTQVAAGRTKGEWEADNSRISTCINIKGGKDSADHIALANYGCGEKQCDDNAQFIALAANCFDELVAVAEAAQEYTRLMAFVPEACNMERSKLLRRIEALRQKVQGLPPELATEGKGEGG